MCVLSDGKGNTEMERRGGGGVVVIVLAPPCPGLAPQPLPSDQASQRYCTGCPALPALVPWANTGGGVRSTHSKVIPLLSTDGPQERALSLTPQQGLGQLPR